MDKGMVRSAPVNALRSGVGAVACLGLIVFPSFVRAEGVAARATIAPVMASPLGNVASGQAQIVAPTPVKPPSKPDSAFANSPASGKQSEMATKMFNTDVSGKMSSFNTQRSAFDGKTSAFDMKASDLTDRRVEIGGRTIYSTDTTVAAFDKRVDVPQQGLFQGMSPMSGSMSSAALAGEKVSSFDARRAPGFDKTVTVVNYQGREADAIHAPKPFAEGMNGGDPITAQFIKNGGSYGATISLEEVRDLINKDAKGASLEIAQPAKP